mmetsp:Transcript_38222/g.82439  ORF Transcript_38222/g.82439 Transcript_38222/m.82439 type:complete len:81 (-) Transcript_38222:221-463(-)
MLLNDMMQRYHQEPAEQHVPEQSSADADALSRLKRAGPAFHACGIACPMHSKVRACEHVCIAIATTMNTKIHIHSAASSS